MKTQLSNFWAVALLLASPIPLLAAPPPNDDFANAADLGSGLTANATGTVDEAYFELEEPFIRYDEFLADFVGSTIWWKWTCPPGNELLVTVKTSGSMEDGPDFDPMTFEPIRIPMDTGLMVFTGTDLASLSPLAESDDSITDVTSELAFFATPGTTYYLRVDSYNPFSMNTDVRLSLSSQAGPPITADAHVAWGKVHLTYRGDWNTTAPEPQVPLITSAALNTAQQHFQSALNLSKTHPEANALMAVVNLLKLQKEPAFVDLLDQLGIQDDSVDPEQPHYLLELDDFGNEKFSPAANSSQGIEYLKTTAYPRLQAALAQLEKITSTTFLGTLPEYMRYDDGVYLDYGDVLMLRGGCKALLALFDMMLTYQLAAPLQQLKELENLDQLNAQSAADLLGDVLKFTSTDKRASIKANLQAAITLYNQASTHIRTKRPLVRDEFHLISLRGDPEQETEVRSQLDRINKSLGGVTIVEDGWSFNLAKLLTGTTSLRALTPNFKGNKVIKGSIPKSDLAGALPGTSATKLEDFLRDEAALWEDVISFGTQVASGQESFGSVNEPPGLFLPGTQHSISATPALGYVFAGWKFNDQLVSPLSPYIFPVLREYTLMAHFAEDNRDDDKDGLSNYSEVQLGTNRSSPDSDGDGWPDGLDTTPLTPNPQAFMVSQNMGAISLNLPVGQITAVTGLPAGVTYDVKNERLVGRPNFLGATVNVPKTFLLVATVKPASGPTFKLNFSLTVEPLPQKFYGTFTGLAERGGLNQQHGGSLSLTVTSSGAVSGKLVMGGVSYIFPAKVFLETQPSPSRQATCVVPAMKPTQSVPAVHVRLTFDADTGSVTGVASPSQTPMDPGEIDLLAERQQAQASLVGAYNSLVTPVDHISDIAYPQGSSYTILKVSSAGVVTWSGKLADGTGITAGGTLGADGEVPWHQMLYTNRGSVQGWTRVQAGRHADLDGITWLKNNIVTPTRSYKPGFPTILNLDLDGSLYDPKTVVFNLLGLGTGNDNSILIFSQANLPANVTQTFRIDTPSLVKLPVPNTQKLALTITASTGVIKGSITPTGAGRKADFEGILVPHRADGGGYFLLPESTLTTSAILSGKMILQGNEN